MAEPRGGVAVRDAAVELARLKEFFQRNLPGRQGCVISTTSNITISDDYRVLLGDVTRSCRYGFQVDNHGTAFPLYDSESIAFRCKIEDATVVQVFRELVARPRPLAGLTLRFPALSAGAPGTWIWPVLDEFAKILEPALPFLSTLDLTLSTLWLNVKTIARSFSLASALRSCALRMNPCSQHSQTSCEDALRTMFRPLITGGNTEIQELVLQCTQSDSAGCACYENAIIDLVKYNGTLEKLEVGDRIVPCPQRSWISGMGAAVWHNRALRELRLHCSCADLRDLVSILVTNGTSVVITSLSTLVVSLTQSSSALDCMTDLARLVQPNSTLQHVRVCEAWRYHSIDSSNFQEALVLQSRIRGVLEQMVGYELQQNVSLQSLSVQWWKAIRVVHGEWKMTYEGPCLTPSKFECFVKVKFQ